jgi:hypothetical protein
MKKSATQTRKRTLELDPTDHIATGARDNSATMEADNDQAVAELVWRYFREEISQTLAEVQEALAPQRSGSSQQVTHRKR